MTEIIQNPNVMKRVQEELAQVVGMDNIVEESHVAKLKYLDATVKETLRLHPAGLFLVPRTPSQDCVLGGYTVPKGCTVLVNAWKIQRDPQYWDNPLEFNPDRFLTGDLANNKGDYYGCNMNFLPFGSGKRVCPAIPLAKRLQMYLLASLLHSFDWSFPGGEKPDLSEKWDLGRKKLKPLMVIPSQRLSSISLYM
uniref:iridoid oxidase-like n=1 Tax=Erigeron canadensis TaxID=72917 RepID=UPI001CB9838B|nr:iridoid oxidase-like [Erigeron canadensis]